MESKAIRRQLILWGVLELVFAVGLVFVWGVHSGIWYVVKGVIFTIFSYFGVNCLWDAFRTSDAELFRKVGRRPRAGVRPEDVPL